MEWFKAWSNEPERPETQMLTDAAFRLWHDGRCYVARTESDGFIPGTQLPRFGRHGTKRNASALVEVGLWQQTPTGYIDLRWEDEQRSAAGMAETRKRTAERVRRVRNAAGNAVTDAATNAVGSGARLEVREEIEKKSEVELRKGGTAGYFGTGNLRVVGAA